MNTGLFSRLAFYLFCLLALPAASLSVSFPSFSDPGLSFLLADRGGLPPAPPLLLPLFLDAGFSFFYFVSSTLLPSAAANLKL